MTCGWAGFRPRWPRPFYARGPQRDWGAWDRRKPSRAELRGARRPETWPPTSDIRAGWWNPVMTETGTAFTLFLLCLSGWNDACFSLPACASPSLLHPAPASLIRSAAAADTADALVQRTVRWETSNFTTLRNFTSVFRHRGNSIYQPPSFPHNLNHVTEPSISIWQCALYILMHFCVFTLLFTRFKMVSADFADGVTHPRVSTDALYFFRIIITHQSHVIVCHTFLSCSAWRKSDVCWLFSVILSSDRGW